MKATSLLTITLAVATLSSCGLVRSVAKIPMGVLRTAGRTVGVSRLTDAPAELPAKTEQTQKDKVTPSGLE
ncbi:MAG: hypothetical protein ACPG32_09080 [Akkermansiaceae bacterium]